jgi:predicted membrane-bound mannosyltransferase
MDKHTRTQSDLDALDEPMGHKALENGSATPDEETEVLSTEQPADDASARHNGHGRAPNGMPLATNSAWYRPAGAAGQTGAPEDALDLPGEAPDTTLDQARRYAPWVALALFAVFPNPWTLGLLGLTIGLNAGTLAQRLRTMNAMQWGVVGLTLLGGVLRFWDLGLKPLHHDESMHAYFSMLLFENPASYRYNPLLHGPFQFHAIAYVYYVASHLGVSDGGVNDVTARTAAAMLGSAMIPMCYFLRRWMGNVGALLAAFLLAVSPIFVYYSRFTREDIYFASFTFATVVAFFKFCEERRLRWLLISVGAFVFAYATKEAAFFNIAIFGGILGGFLAWELGSRSVYGSARAASKERDEDELDEAEPGAAVVDEEEPGPAPAPVRLPLGLNTHAGVPALLLYFGLAGTLAKVVLNWVGSTSRYLAGVDVNADPTIVQSRLDQANTTVQNLENALVNGLLIVLVAIAVLVLAVVLWQLFSNPYGVPGSGSPARGLAKWIDPQRQPLLNGLADIPWAHWFFALLVAFVIFSALFWIWPNPDPAVCPAGVTNPPSGAICSWSQGFHQGVGDGLVQGIYYWIQQQQVARGGQPWYYYLILIPFYEQLIVLFGLGGLVRCLARPNRFRLFVVFWFIASLFLYSWAGEKMPWLALHILLPLLLLAALALEWAVLAVLDLLSEMAAHRLAGRKLFHWSGPFSQRRYAGAVFSLVGAFLLLIPMLHSMLFVTYVDPGDAPHEMLSYVQTTTDVTLVMSKIDALDQKLYQGKHELRIGVDGDNIWPFAWYLRDYKYVWYNYSDEYPTANGPNDLDVLLIEPGSVANFITPDAAQPHPIYNAHQYHLRSWWDEGYKPAPCVPTRTKTCDPNLLWGGVGPGLWLSYGDNPPKGASFNPGKAFGNFWAWLWTRKAIGATNGSTDFTFLVRSDLPMQP